jgi:hypothetical protein
MRIGIAICLPIFYLILVVLHTSFNFEEEVYARVIFPLLFGMIPIVLISITWVNSIKEDRIRKFNLLPMKVHKLVLGKLLTAYLPLIILLVFGLLFLPKSNSEWSPITDRILYQYGTTSLLVSTLYIVYELLNTVSFAKDISRILIGLPFFAVCIFFVFVTDNALWTKISQSFIGVIYSCVAAILLLLGGYIFTKRKFYLV